MSEEAPVTESPVEIVDDAESVEEAGGAVTGAKGRRLTSAEWKEIEEHYEYGTLSLNEIVQKYGITTDAIRQRFRRAKEKGRIIKKNSKAHLRAAKLAAMAAAAATGTPAPTTEEIEQDFETKRKKRIELTKETIYRQTEMMQRATIQLQNEIHAKTRTAADLTADFKALRHLGAVIRETLAIRSELLGIDKEDSENALAILQIEDLSAAEIERMQNQNNDEDEDEDEIALDLKVEEDETLS